MLYIILQYMPFVDAAEETVVVVTPVVWTKGIHCIIIMIIQLSNNTLTY